MAVPKAKTSKSCRGMRRSHNALKRINVSENKDGDEVRPHHVSRAGRYNGRQVTTAKVNN